MIPTTPPVCEADERCRQALHEIGRQQTEDAISLHRIRLILAGDTCRHEEQDQQ